MPSDFDDLTKTTEDRRRIFTPDWFRDLLGARLGLGDTFWIGNYGVALLYVPFVALVPVILWGVGLSERGVNIYQGVIWSLITLYMLALSRAVFMTARRTPQVGGWRWVGVALTVANVLIAAMGARLLFTGGM